MRPRLPDDLRQFHSFQMGWQLTGIKSGDPPQSSCGSGACYYSFTLLTVRAGLRKTPWKHCGPPESYDQNADAPPDAANECVQQELWATYCLHFAYYNF